MACPPYALPWGSVDAQCVSGVWDSVLRLSYITTPIYAHCATQLHPRHTSGMPPVRPSTDHASLMLDQHKAGATGGSAGPQTLALLLSPVWCHTADADALNSTLATVFGWCQSVCRHDEGIGLCSQFPPFPSLIRRHGTTQLAPATLFHHHGGGLAGLGCLCAPAAGKGISSFIHLFH